MRKISKVSGIGTKYVITFMTMAIILLLSGSANAATLTVDDSGGANYIRIQDAINNAASGDIIEVYSGTYYENVNVNKRLTLRGIGMPVVNAGGSGSTITLAEDGITLEGFTATGAGSNPNAGIKVISSSNTLRGNNATSNFLGIWLDSPTNNNMLIGNNASNNIIGIRLHAFSTNNTLSGNNASSNYDGIQLMVSSNNTLSGNNANSNIMYGIYLYSSSNNNTLNGNNASSNNQYGIWLDHSSNNTLIGNNATSNSYGIGLVSSSNNNTLSGNHASLNSYYGIDLSYSTINNKIFNNFFNNSNNFRIRDTLSNIWNSTRTSGINIIGGSYLGGNFWANPGGTGFSQTCADANGDGICDSAYVLDANNIDYLPLAALPLVRFINGTVKDNSTGNSFAGVTVSANSTLSNTSDATGFYSFAVTDGTYNLISTINDIRFYSNTTTVSTNGQAVVIRDIEMIRKPTGNITGIVTRST